MTSNVGQRASISKSGEGEILVKSGGMRLKVGAAQTDGDFEVVELYGPGEPPAHVHHTHDECFYVIEGTFTFTLGGEEVDAPADTIVFVPQGTPHSFKHSDDARALVFVVPSHLEGFFRELGDGLAAGRSEGELRVALSEKYDSQPIV